MKSVSPLSFTLAFTEIPVKSPGELEAKFLRARAPQSILKQEMHARCLPGCSPPPCAALGIQHSSLLGWIHFSHLAAPSTAFREIK